jgi:hypothetical protein
MSSLFFSNRTLVWSVSGYREEFSNELISDGLGIVELDDGLEVTWVSFLDGMQRVLLFTEDRNLCYRLAHSTGENERIEREIDISIFGVGISIVNNAPNCNYEIIYTSVSSSDIVWEIRKTGKSRYKSSRIRIPYPYPVSVSRIRIPYPYPVSVSVSSRIHLQVQVADEFAVRGAGEGLSSVHEREVDRQDHPGGEVAQDGRREAGACSQLHRQQERDSPIVKHYILRLLVLLPVSNLHYIVKIKNHS